MPDPEPPEPSRSRFVVDPARTVDPGGPTAWTMIGAAAVLAIVILSAWGVLAERMNPSPAPPAGAAPPTSAGAATPVLPVADVLTVDQALDRLATLAGWDGCPVWRAFGVGDPVSRKDVEAVIGTSGQDGGLIHVTDSTGASRPVWVGGDIQVAARGLGGTFIVRESDAAWTVIPVDGRQVAVRLAANARRDGGTYWQISGRAEPAPYCAGAPATSTGPAHVVHVEGDGLAALVEAAGWAGCRTWQRAETQPLPTSATIEEAAAAALVLPDGEGWVDVKPGGDARSMRVWLGRDEAKMASVHGSSLMAIGSDDPRAAWLRVTFDDRPLVIQLRRVDTDHGWRAWLPTPNAAGLTPTADPKADRCGVTSP